MSSSARSSAPPHGKAYQQRERQKRSSHESPLEQPPCGLRQLREKVSSAPDKIATTSSGRDPRAAMPNRLDSCRRRASTLGVTERLFQPSAQALRRLQMQLDHQPARGAHRLDGDRHSRRLLRQLLRPVAGGRGAVQAQDAITRAQPRLRRRPAGPHRHHAQRLPVVLGGQSGQGARRRLLAHQLEPDFRQRRVQPARPHPDGASTPPPVPPPARPPLAAPPPAARRRRSSTPPGALAAAASSAFTTSSSDRLPSLAARISASSASATSCPRA